MFVDTHCHLEDENFAEDRAEVLARAKSVGVEKIINFGSTMKSSAAIVELTKNFSGLYGGVGVHPEEIDDFDKNSCAHLAEFAAEKNIVAIGEIGLDYHWEKDSERRLIQQKIFIAQLDLARQLHLPVCVHDRDAHADTLKILQTEGHDLRGVLHCYSGSVETAREIFKLDWFIGVDGPLTFKNSAKVPEVVKAAPRDRILIETDAPYLAPVPHRGKRNEPAFVVDVAKKLAEVRGDTLEQVAEYTTANANDLYHIF
ncbi:MAG: TatD family hydrolase [Selenomonadaceae bacterium]|nr:TatD family hydrolase [Selenomonadaceae bacterium]